MSVVSTNQSLTAPTRNALGENLDALNDAYIRMSTGYKYTKASEDPSGRITGESVKNQRDVTAVVLDGLEQSAPMLSIAEDGLKSAYKVVKEINNYLLRATLGYMTDKVVENTLSPGYMQLQEEFNRIANSIDFNGQKLLNGTGGKVTAGVVSTIDPSLVVYDMAAAASAFSQYGNTTTSLGTFTATITDNGGDTTSAATLNLKPSANNVIPRVSGGTLTKSGTDFILVDATLTIPGVSVTSDTGATTKSAIADLKITGVTLTLTATMNNDVLTFTAAPKVTDVKPNNVSFTNFKPGVSPNGITNISTTEVTTPPTLTAGSISGIESEYTSTGGQGTVSTFRFVTGTNLAKDITEVDMPNLCLYDKVGAPGVISTLNISGLQSSVTPTGLTELKTIADAYTDIPIVAALGERVLTFYSALGAYQLRFSNMIEQLTTAVQELDNAQGAILNADLPKNAEDAARAKVNINIAILSLNELNQVLSSLQKIVTG